MIIKLDPSSGYDNSYYDVRFFLTLNKKIDTNFKLSFINRNVSRKLEILAISKGFIDSAGVAHIDSCRTVDGYINLFNDDKMNKELARFHKVEIECIVETKDETINEIATFYNESYSTDQEIIPFQIFLENDTIDLSKSQPLRFFVLADAERSFHISLESLDNTLSTDFYILTKNGKISFEIPPEILHYELSLYKMKHLDFQFCYLKRHGVNYNNTINEKKIVVP